MLKKSICSLQCDLPVTHDPAKIIVHGAQEHNLKNICFEIPKGKLVVLTGPSGSGKSSIATDVLQKECIRQYLESMGMTTDHIEKANVQSITGLSPSIGVSQRVADFNPRSTVGTKTGILTILRNMFAALGQQPCIGCAKNVRQPLQDKDALTTIEIEEKNGSSLKKRKKSYFNCPHCNQQLEKLTMAHFSYNTTAGACTMCKGIGENITVDFTRLLDEEKTIMHGGVDLWDEPLAQHYQNIILAASKHYNFYFDATMPIKNYTQKQKDFLLYGITHPDFLKEYKNIKTPKKVSEGNFEGIIPPLLAVYKKNPLKVSQDIKKYILHEPCTTCNATGLAPLGRKVTVSGKTISDAIGLSLNEFLNWLHDLDTIIPENDVSILTAVSGALKERASNLIEVGLHYLTLDRTVPSLSAGEAQRLRLAGLLGSELCGVLYVLDEPTTGLHPHDTAKLLKTLRRIQQAGNTVLVIEHDLDVIRNADHIIDIGPEGGSKGGTIIASGTPADIMACTQSSTGKYLAKKRTIPLNNAPRKKETLTIRGAREHNLKNIDVSIPLKQFVVMTGVSGSGKSTFLFDIVDKAARKYFNNAREAPGNYASLEGLDYLNRIITVDQSAIGITKSTRSNVATYTKLFDHIRDLFAALPEAKNHGFGAEKFSFNTSDQRCQNCNGAGVVEVDMTFMPDIQKECPVCNGTRFNEDLLIVQFKGHNIANVLDMTVSEALAIFRQEKKIFTFLDLMRQVGLEYLTLGQSTSTLSGGEAQRIKLAAELAKSETGNTLYLLDEPTTGLHPQEVEKLLTILKRLVDQGNTVVAIEHNLEAIAQADTIIDFGPGGGSAGGTIVAIGTPEEIAQDRDSLTGQALKAFMIS
jgi:excinuclease ABC subunit A